MLENLKKKFNRTAKRITGRKLSSEDVDDIISDLRVGLLESDVAVTVTDEIIEKVEERFEEEEIGIRDNVRDKVFEILRDVVGDILSTESDVDIIKTIEENRKDDEPAVLLFVGVNGCGKTTTIAKVTKFLQDRDYEVVLAAADTFRAAGIEQLEEHGEKLGARVIKHQKGSDAAAVAYDAVEHASAEGIDVVMIDTAGRMQTDANLMEEMKKIARVSEPDLTIFVGDALTGNDSVEQASKFEEAIDIDGSILTKMDADARGGAALSIIQETGEPILFLGVGQEYEDLSRFEPDVILDALFPEE